MKNELKLLSGNLDLVSSRRRPALRQLWDFLCCHPTTRFNRQALLGVAGFENAGQLREGLNQLVDAGLVRACPGGELYALCREKPAYGGFSPLGPDSA